MCVYKNERTTLKKALACAVLDLLAQSENKSAVIYKNDKIYIRLFKTAFDEFIELIKDIYSVAQLVIVYSSEKNVIYYVKR